MSDPEIQNAVIEHAQADLARMPQAPSMPEAHYTIGEAAGAVIEGLGDALMSAAEKLIPQGAAEIAQGLFTGNPYVPYGPTDMAVPMDGGVFGPDISPPGWETAGGPVDIHGPAVQSPEAATPMEASAISSPLQDQGYEAMLAEYASRPAPEPEHEMER